MFVSPVFPSPGRTTLTSAGIPHRALYTSSQTPSTAFYAQQNAPSAQDPGNPEFLPHSMDHAAGQFLGPHARLPFNVPPFAPVKGTLAPTAPDHLYAYPSCRPAHISGDAPAVVPPRHSALNRDLAPLLEIPAAPAVDPPAPAAPCFSCGRTDSVPTWTGYHVSPTQLTDVQRNTSPATEAHFAPVNTVQNPHSLTISTAHLQPERPAVDDLRPHNVERNHARSSATQALIEARRLGQRLPTPPPPDTGDAPRGTLLTLKQTASLAHQVSDSRVLPIPVHDGPQRSSPAKLNAITNGTTHKIVTTDGPPVRHKARRLPPHKLRLAKAAVEELLRTGIVRPSDSN
ncbi:uncharacterized protein LOC126195488 [Schistocerca nitens]|uniref:uncharacterized protein LOC126195488 n=1 Tax=Schistocerca nitens TaxID=7011 RepID=UPI0021176EA5|nr:uncharacterized protein LOC126195488 [Schistocerca nitens]